MPNETPTQMWALIRATDADGCVLYAERTPMRPDPERPGICVVTMPDSFYVPPGGTLTVVPL